MSKQSILYVLIGEVEFDTREVLMVASSKERCEGYIKKYKEFPNNCYDKFVIEQYELNKEAG